MENVQEAVYGVGVGCLPYCSQEEKEGSPHPYLYKDALPPADGGCGGLAVLPGPHPTLQ